ncbi:MAG: glycosyltransferase family 4 protein [Sulfuritalea sp.]|nr:glycosyltransferase family 4 protein [Sulfuritalea sp.]
MKKAERFDVIYCECSGDIVAAFDLWSQGQSNPSPPVQTYSSQFFAFARQARLRVYALSGNPRPARSRRDNFCVAHHAKTVFPIPVVGYHLGQFVQALVLARLALRHRPRVMLVDSGVTDWIFLLPLRILGVRIVAVLHNSLWPNGFSPRTLLKRLWLGADRLFFRHVAHAAFCVSPLIERQLRCLAPGSALPVVQFRVLFDPRHFPPETAAPASAVPFRVMFAGRIERNKGVFDHLAAARLLETEHPGRFVHEVCGDGGDLDELARRVDALGLSAIFRLHGQLDRESLLARYRASHVVVVPTRSDFCEGFAQVVAEAVLLCRPVVTNAVVPAAEILHEAILEFHTDDAESLAACIRRLAASAELYQAKRSACMRLRDTLLDARCSFGAQLSEHRDLFRAEPV